MEVVLEALLGWALFLADLVIVGGCCVSWWKKCWKHMAPCVTPLGACLWRPGWLFTQIPLNKAEHLLQAWCRSQVLVAAVILPYEADINIATHSTRWDKVLPTKWAKASEWTRSCAIIFWVCSNVSSCSLSKAKRLLLTCCLERDKSNWTWHCQSIKKIFVFVSLSVACPRASIIRNRVIHSYACYDVSVEITKKDLS